MSKQPASPHAALNRRIIRVVTLGLLGLAGCRHDAASRARTDTPIAQTDTPRIAPGPDVAPRIVLPAPPPPPVAPDAGVPVDAATAYPQGMEALLRAIASGQVAPQSAIDPVRGLLLVDFLEATPGGSGESFIGRHLCGDDTIRRWAHTMRSLLSTAVAQAVDMESSFNCHDLECSVDGMEYQPAIHVRFARRPSGEPVIVAIHRISEALMSDDWLRRARRYVASQTADARTPCPVTRDAGAPP